MVCSFYLNQLALFASKRLATLAHAHTHMLVNSSPHAGKQLAFCERHLKACNVYLFVAFSRLSRRTHSDCAVNVNADARSQPLQSSLRQPQTPTPVGCPKYLQMCKRRRVAATACSALQTR